MRRNTLLVPIAIFTGTTAIVASCTPPRSPLEISRISVSPDPILGRIVTLSVEVESSKDEPDTQLVIYLPDGIKSIEGALTWRGSLQAETPSVHQTSICVQYEGDWKIIVTAVSQRPEGYAYDTVETLRVQSSPIYGRAIMGRNYRTTQPAEGMPLPTSLPANASTTICQPTD